MMTVVETVVNVIAPVMTHLQPVPISVQQVAMADNSVMMDARSNSLLVAPLVAIFAAESIVRVVHSKDI